jgi:tRNA A37 threonylcarbamoyladenosine modification protein TsaB
VPIIHSSGNEYYVAAYDCHQLRFIVSEQLAKVEDLSDLLPEKSLLFGEKISQLREALEKISDKRHAEWSYPELLATPSPHAVAKLALDYLTLKKNLIELTTQPNYLRSSEVERKRGEISPL